MQFQAVLSNQHHPESGVVTVPFPIPRAEYDNTIALLGPLEIGDAVSGRAIAAQHRGAGAVRPDYDNGSLRIKSQAQK